MTLEVISWIGIALGVLTGAAIAYDCYHRPQPMNVMNITWPITGLYMPVVGWWLYSHMGRAQPASEQSGHGHHHHGDKPKWQSVFVSVTHCGGGCTLGDSVAAPIVTSLGFTVFGSELLAHFTGEFIAAYLFGILFQLLPIMSMGQSNLGKALIDAIKADTLSLVAFEIGMFGSLAIIFLGILPEMPHVATATYWFMMQIAMVLGFATAYPANWWLVNAGIKHGM